MSILLASNLKALIPIVIPAAPTQQMRYAANELRTYLGLIATAAFDVMEGGAHEGAQIALLPGDAALGEDGFEITSDGNRLTIAGGKRGLIYGVYELLEHLGCRFFTPECEKIPSIPELEMPELNTRQVPVLEYREHHFAAYWHNPRFAVKSRVNGHFPPIKEEWGGHMEYVWFVHTMDNLVSPGVYGQTHPEYFALIDGERYVAKERTQLCLTNPEVLAIAIESTRAALLAHPEARIISISQNDNYSQCQCEACRAVDLEEGSASGTLLRFVNAIAEALEPEFPDVIFDTLAYQYTRPVPRVTKPRHNVCVRLCSIESCFAHPFETCDDDRSITLPDGSKTSFLNDLRSWGNYHDRLYIWDYTTCFAHYPAPYPNWRVLQPNMQAFIRNHVKGVFEQGNGSQRGGVDFNELRAYIICKLLWDADCDVERHIREFTDYYYGAAAPFVRQYIDALCDKAEKDNIHVGFNDTTDTPLYSEEMLDLLDGIMDQAESAVRGDALRLFRIGKARLAVRYVRLKNRTKLKGEFDPDEVNAFFADWRAYGLSRINEWVPAELTHRALIKRAWRGEEFLEHWTASGPETF